MWIANSGRRELLHLLRDESLCSAGSCPTRACVDARSRASASACAGSCADVETGRSVDGRPAARRQRELSGGGFAAGMSVVRRADRGSVRGKLSAMRGCSSGSLDGFAVRLAGTAAA